MKKILFMLLIVVLMPTMVFSGGMVGVSGSGVSLTKPVLPVDVGGWTFVGSATGDGSDPGSGTTLDCSTSLNVADGDVLVGIFRYETIFSTVTLEATIGDANTFTELIHEPEPVDGFVYVGYMLNAAANTTSTFRATTSIPRNYRRLIVLQFRPNNKGVAQLGSPVLTATGTGTALASPNYTSIGAHPLTIGFGGHWSRQITE